MSQNDEVWQLLAEAERTFKSAYGGLIAAQLLLASGPPTDSTSQGTAGSQDPNQEEYDALHRRITTVLSTAGAQFIQWAAPTGEGPDESMLAISIQYMPLVSSGAEAIGSADKRLRTILQRINRRRDGLFAQVIPLLRRAKQDFADTDETLDRLIALLSEASTSTQAGSVQAPDQERPEPIETSPPAHPTPPIPDNGSARRTWTQVFADWWTRNIGWPF